MTTDYFAEMKKQPYNLYTAPRPYSFDVNEDMIKILREEFNADRVSDDLVKALDGKEGQDAVNAAVEYFRGMGSKWMNRVIQLADEYPDRTIEMVLETVDRDGRQFLIFPHLLQRYIEVANLANQSFLKVPVILNNMYEFSYRIPKCLLYAAIADKLGADFAGKMTCQNYCLTALETTRKKIELETLLSMPATTAQDKFCEFSIRKL